MVTDWGDFPDIFNPDETGKLALIAAGEAPLFFSCYCYEKAISAVSHLTNSVESNTLISSITTHIMVSSTPVLPLTTKDIENEARKNLPRLYQRTYLSS